MKISDFIPFLVHAKQSTYASGKAAESSSRPGSHDFIYEDGKLTYIDTYLGSFHFIGEEAVWQGQTALWGMNYYGKMLVEQIPEGFGDFLKACLRQIPVEAPYRGPALFEQGAYSYQCHWEGDPQQFSGWEEISFHDVLIYRLEFHGGEIKD